MYLFLSVSSNIRFCDTNAITICWRTLFSPPFTLLYVLGYHGLYCEEEYNECLSAPCQNGATCRDLVNSYECVCLAEYEGKTCISSPLKKYFIEFKKHNKHKKHIINVTVIDNHWITRKQHTRRTKGIWTEDDKRGRW